jgi:phosphoglycolate phosphatase
LAQSKLIMFDFDGVIADSLDDQSRAFVAAMRTAGFAELATPEQFLAFTEGNWFEELAAAGVPPSVVDEIEDAFGAGPTPRLFPDMATVIERLAGDHRVVVITSSRTNVVAGVLAEHGVRGVAEVIGGDQDESKTRKIDDARRRFGRALAAWYVGDTVGDIIEARRAGAGTVGATWGWHGIERLRRANPDHLAHAPADLLQLFHSGSGGAT